MGEVMACIDGSVFSAAVCDYAAWAALRLGAPLSLLHVLDPAQLPGPLDYSGSFNPSARQALLGEYVAVDEPGSRIARRQGERMLGSARQRTLAAGCAPARLRQRPGELIDCLGELQERIDLLVLGRQGEAGGEPGARIGRHLQPVIRSIPRPILVSGPAFTAPRGFLLGFAGGPTAAALLDQAAHCPLLHGLQGHLLLVGADSAANRAQLEAARRRLADAGLWVQGALRQGDPLASLVDYQREHHLDLLVMGAYGHSRLRQWLAGSTTRGLLQRSPGALLILR